MLFLFISILLPLLFVFGLYHLMVWFNVFHVNERSYWKRVAIAAAVSHVLLLTGFIVFTYAHFNSMRAQLEAPSSFTAFVFDRSEFWRFMLIFDTAPMLAVLGLFSLLDRAGINPPGLLVWTFAITYAVGTLQWFFVGGAVGAILEKFWSGLKTPDEEDEGWL
jgi:hypothetical protein